jgi:hypothetical protein
MKTFFTTILFVLISFSIFAQGGVQWSMAARIANNSFSNLHPRITLDRKNNPLVIWGSGTKVYFARWTGTAFSTPIVLNPMSIPIFTASWAGPDIASKGDTVYVVFKHTPEDTNHIYIVGSFDGGQNFSTPVRVDYIGTNISRFPAVTTDAAGNPLVAFMKFDPGFTKSRYVVTRSTDFGKTFSTDVLASGFSGGTVCDCCPATVLSSGNKSVMLYRDNLSNVRDIWAGISSDGAQTYSTGFNADQSKWTINSCPASGPDGFILGNSMYGTYMSQSSGTSLVYVSKSDMSTNTAGKGTPVTGAFSGLYSQNYPRIATDGLAGAIVWRQTTSGGGQIVMSFTDDLNNGFPTSISTIASGTLINADLAMSPGKIFTVWEDDGTGSVYFRQGTYHTSGIETPAVRSIEHIYPIPATGLVNIDIPGADGIRKVELVNSVGQYIPVAAEYSETNIHIPLSGIPAGYYTILIRDNSGNLYSGKLPVAR